MEEVIGTMPITKRSAGNPRTSGAQLPLSMIRAGETAHVLRLRGREEFHHRLETLGFVEGAEVSILSRADKDVIVGVKGAQLAIDETTASKIIVC